MSVEYGGPDRRRGGPDRRAPGETTRVLIVDDHALFRAGVAGILAREPDIEVVGEADDARSAVDRAIALSRDTYCSVWHSLRTDIAFHVTYDVIA